MIGSLAGAVRWVCSEEALLSIKAWPLDWHCNDHLAQLLPSIVVIVG